jgi:putative ABC transport system substrate-binding protein
MTSIARRMFLITLGCAAVTWSSGTRAQSAKPARIGLVSLHAPALAGHVDHIREGLRQLGHVDGKTFEIESHFTDGNKQQAQAILKSFLDKRVDIIVAWTTPTVQLAKDATQTVPVVMISSDPVAAKLVQSLSRPGGNLSGVSMSGPDLAGKRLELLRELKPGIAAVAFLGYAPSTGAAAFIRETKANATKIGLKLMVRQVDRPDAIDDALFADLKRDGAEAVIVQPFFFGHATEVVAHAMKSGLPVISDYPVFAKAGALASLGVNEAAQVRRTAYFIDRILKGAKPAELPVEQPTAFELAINVRTAKMLGLKVSPLLLARADEVIE